MVEKSNYFLYSKDASDEHKRRVTQKRWIQNTKILQFKKLCNFITTHLETQSLKGIAGRSKLAYKSGSIETTISHTALYSYIDNENVKFIDSTALRRRKKQKYRLKYAGKRQNGKSIDERPEVINNRKEFGH
jgi:IS30 family transposase